MNYFKKLWRVLNTIDTKAMNIEFDATYTGNDYRQEVFDLTNNLLYEITITRNELRNLKDDELKNSVLYKLKNERTIA